MSTSTTESNYLTAVDDLYREAAENPMSKLCCTTSPVWRMPGLVIPNEMIEMNYGCGTTVHAKDLEDDQTVLYVGVGGGMEALQFAYFTRRPSSVIAVDTVDEMMDKARQNLAIAAKQNAWFDESFVDIRRGNALDLPIESGTVDIAAQNCLFNVFTRDHLLKALTEMHRVLKPHGKLFMSDPVATRDMPEHLAKDERLRAECLSGAVTLDKYLETMVEAGFGTIEVRAKIPYRILDKDRNNLDEHLLLESVEICAIKDPIPEDGACIFTGCTATFFGKDEYFDDKKGHVMMRDLPLNICDKTANALLSLGREDMHVTDSTWFYNGGGCC